jgi:hypothetical protein
MAVEQYRQYIQDLLLERANRSNNASTILKRKPKLFLIGSEIIIS